MTEEWNLRRLIHGLTSTKAEIVQIEAGMSLACGRHCRVSEIVAGQYVVEEHGLDCRICRAGSTERVRISPEGQAVVAAGTPENPQVGVLLLSGLFPHEESRAAAGKEKENHVQVS